MTPAYLRKRWEPQDLPVERVREHGAFQVRLRGIDDVSVKRIMATLGAGGDTRDPIRVAHIGQAYYVVDGFHRLAAYRSGLRETIPSLVAKMSLPEAKEAARGYNAMNGRKLSQDDKRALWESYLARGDHRDAMGVPKKARAISVELGGMWSHETVRQKLRAAGELDDDVEFDGAYKPFDSDSDPEDDLEADLVDEAAKGLLAFGERIADVNPVDRQRLVRAARLIVEAVEKGDTPDLSDVTSYRLDI